MLVEAQLAAGREHAAELRERGGRVGDAAEHQTIRAASNAPSSEGSTAASPSTSSIGTRASAARSAAASLAVGSGSTASTRETAEG
jgi:hypothetical protein